MDTLSEPADRSGPSLIPPIEMWDVQAARWTGDGSVLESVGAPGQYLLTSPPINLEPGHGYAFSLDVDIHDDSVVVFGLIDSASETWIDHEAAAGNGFRAIHKVIIAQRPISVILCLADGRDDDASPTRVSGLSVEAFKRKKGDPPAPLATVIPPVGMWEVQVARWAGDGTVLESVDAPGQFLLASPRFDVEPDHEYVFRLDLHVHGDSVVVFGLLGTKSGKWIEQRVVGGEGHHVCLIEFTAERPMSVRLGLADDREDDALPVRISNLAVRVLERTEDEPPIPLTEIVPPLNWWKVEHGSWNKARTVLESVGPPGQILLTSPPVTLKEAHDYAVILDAEIIGAGAADFGFLDPNTARWIEHATVSGAGDHTCPVLFTPDRDMAVLLVLADGRADDEGPTRARNLGLTSFERRPDDPPIRLAKIIPPALQWKVDDAAWSAERRRLESIDRPGQNLLTSPAFELFPGHRYVFRVDMGVYGDGDVVFGLIDAKTGNWIEVDRTVAYGAKSCSIVVVANRRRTVYLCLNDARRTGDAPIRIWNLYHRCFEHRPGDPPVPLSEIIPPPLRWKTVEVAWKRAQSVLESQDQTEPHYLVSPEFRVDPGRRYAFILSFTALDHGAIRFAVDRAPSGPTLASRVIVGKGQGISVVPFTSKTSQTVRLVISDSRRHRLVERVRFRDLSLEVREYGTVETLPSLLAADTVLPHWGPVRRLVHGMCRSWRTWNSLVAAIEMRLGWDELLSLPQYMALCPTGQCNALCEFCSVTINRTGILKQQLPDANLERFLAPVANTIHMYGLEGNGEPTLHRSFPELLQRLLANGSKAYLITNGSRLSPSVIALLLGGGVDSVNFSLNAASAETHRRVMKLKDFDRVVESIKTLTRGRGDWLNPLVSTSLVVEAKNIHEVQDFLRFSEHELDVDRIFVRPISELGTDLGTVEDVRDLLPYESDVRDMLDGVRDYLDDTPRRAEIVVVPENFRAVRPDPLDRVLMPLGFEDRLLAPRRGDWTPAPAVRAKWSVNRVRLDAEPSAAGGSALVSRPIPVDAGRRLRFRARVWSAGFPLEIAVTDETGRTVAGGTVASGQDRAFETVEFPVDTADHEELSIMVRHPGGTLRAEIEFERLRTPAPKVRRSVRLPHPGRWEIDAADADVRWEGSRLHLRRRGNPGTYIVKSYSVPCMPDCDISLCVRVELRSGGLGIGVLDQDASRYIAKLRLEEAGDSAAVIEFNTGENRSFRLALYGLENPADGGHTLDATVDWLDRNLDSASDHWQGSPSLAAAARPRIKPNSRMPGPAAPGDAVWGTVIRPDAEDRPPPHGSTASGLGNLLGRKWRTARWMFLRPGRIRHVAFSKVLHYANTMTEFAVVKSEAARLALASIAAEVRRSAFFGALHRLVYGKPHFYCQKPWTDLANFSVDGRMDVCCIATGASQERFALGNLMHQDFQEVWNGERAREFRRTVNSDTPLPPCRRCPMAYAYQGPFFDRRFTLSSIRDTWLGAGLFRWLRGWRGAGVLQYVTFYPLVYALYIPCYLVLNFIWFRNFKR